MSLRTTLAILFVVLYSAQLLDAKELEEELVPLGEYWKSVNPYQFDEEKLFHDIKQAMDEGKYELDVIFRKEDQLKLLEFCVKHKIAWNKQEAVGGGDANYRAYLMQVKLQWLQKMDEYYRRAYEGLLMCERQQAVKEQTEKLQEQHKTVQLSSNQIDRERQQSDRRLEIENAEREINKVYKTKLDEWTAQFFPGYKEDKSYYAQCSSW